MARRPLVYWSDTVHPDIVCMGCGQTINFDEEIALVAVQAPVSANPSEEEMEGVDRTLLCSDCGTNVDTLVKLGMRRIIDLEIEDPSVSDEPDDVEMLEPIAGEKKN